MTTPLGLDPTLLEALRQQFRERLPELSDKLERALAEEDPAKFQEVITTLISDIGVQGALAESVRQVDPDTLGMTRISPVTPEDREQVVALGPKGAPRLNPLFEAALMERLQFDGDVPELRHGPAPRGVLPAIGVDTEVSNPVALGLMMEKAQETVKASVEEAQTQSDKLLEDYGKNTTTALTVAEVPAIESSLYKSQHGKTPTALVVDEPEGKVLLALTPDRQKELTWKATATTQGRRSALGAIEQRLRKGLETLGFEVVCAQTSDPDFHVSWTFPLQKGHTAASAGFSHIEVAGATMLKKLRNLVAGSSLGPVTLQVTTLDGISEGVVGWEANLSVNE